MSFAKKLLCLSALALLLPTVSGESMSKGRSILTLSLEVEGQRSCEAEAQRLANALTVLLELPVFGDCLPLADSDAIGPGQRAL
jgi:hypothetical protein